MKRFFRFFVLLLALALTTGAPLVARAQETAPAEEHGMTLYASKLAKFGPWHRGQRRYRAVLHHEFHGRDLDRGPGRDRLCADRHAEHPGGSGRRAEFLGVAGGGLYSFLEGIIGHDLVKKTFWFFATIFIFILCSNWFGLIPGVGTHRLGAGHGRSASRT